MSWCRSFWRVLAVFLPVALAAPLVGCIQPLYGPAMDGVSTASELQAVEVDEIPDRIGHYVRNELIQGFNGTGSQVTPRYRLKVKLTERVQTPIFNTTTSFSTSATVVVDANYSLMTLPDNVEIAKGVAQALASYDRFTARFTNVRAARDAEIRDAKVIADSIRTRIAIDLANRH
jgi:LPS-assembly lipoprotein